jgi:predicted TIM-barrel fold metal-dependent hydrolase
MNIDAHQHFWFYNEAEYALITSGQAAIMGGNAARFYHLP